MLKTIMSMLSVSINISSQRNMTRTGRKKMHVCNNVDKDRRKKNDQFAVSFSFCLLSVGVRRARSTSLDEIRLTNNYFLQYNKNTQEVLILYRW